MTNIFSFSFFKTSLLCASLALAGCSTSPTGRGQVIMFSDTEMTQLGTQSFEEMKKQEKISLDKKTNQYVACVTNAITKQLPPQNSFQHWEVVVFDSKQVNAFALPGGKIGVYTGLLKVAENQDQLATVIGHEIAHVLANHSNERLSQSQITNLGLQLSSAALSGSEYHSMAMAGLGLGAQVGILLPYGRTQESESDILGLELMAKAGFNPNESIKLWQNMAKAADGAQPPELLSTHPSHSTRIKDLQNKINKLPKYQTNKPNCKA
ncbi:MULTISPECIES: M48 family metallopeptidase [unclassified Motilimonas]|uniref:M48 family metallopeptidase n=1 Tax=unclassified Motilimonas TaxID=2643697 RepID=UPI001E4AA336|nr:MULTISPECIES: M48 family metallopeptidase [unclassified Motilimonas]MCE0557789.1 M48 family metallopeptidase [Motilimonas sp. E26]MDO6525910.1 M48 family metallopeptidase [Motilimonas sp. 1_MG-2023]